MAPDTRRLAKIMKALSNENRLALYLEIAQQQETDFEEPACMVSSVMKLFKLSAPTISHHLKELANAELITTERKGKFLVARINRDTIDEVEQALSIAKGS
ncbi:MAG: metalloregulator ArsR/SmtB family transcription factor [bacterium]